MPTTFYVSDTNGNDGNDGESQAQATKTIGAALGKAGVTAGDIIEIIDEATYDDETFPLQIPVNNLTLTHTASELGIPVIDASGESATNPIKLQVSSGATTRTGFTLNGIEVKGSGDVNQQLLTIYPAGTDNANGLTVTECFIYQVSAIANGDLHCQAGQNIRIKQSSFMFTNKNQDAIRFGADGSAGTGGGGQFEIENCFLSRSATGVGGESLNPILTAKNSSKNATASFCTFKFEEVGTNIEVIKTFPKVINCVVSGSGANLKGIDAADHTFNVVNVQGTAFLNGQGSADSAHASEKTDAVTFVDGTSTGHTQAVVQNFALAAGSVGIDQGTSFNSIDVDINDTVRPQGAGFDMGAFELIVPPWNDFDDNQTYQRKWGTGLEIHGTANKLTTRRFPNGTTGRQAPYFVTIPGPANLRERTTAYKNET